MELLYIPLECESNGTWMDIIELSCTVPSKYDFNLLGLVHVKMVKFSNLRHFTCRSYQSAKISGER